MSYRKLRGTTRSCGGIATTVLLVATVSGTAAAQDSLQVATQPNKHVVQVGETLWGLASLYLGNPFLWPEIYRLNTSVVEDPHWIFPGEELFLAMPEATAVPVEPPVAPPEGDAPEQDQGVQRPVEAPPVEAPAVEVPPPPPPPPPVSEATPTVFRAQRGTAATRAAPTGPVRSFSAVRRGDFYGAGFLTENDALPWASVVGRAEPGAGGGAIRASATMFEHIRVRAPDGATYQLGDTLLTARLSREIPRWGRVVVPSGLAVVTHVAGRDVVARVAAQFDRVVEGNVAMPAEPFRSLGDARAARVENGLTANVIAARDRHPVPNQQDIIFIDRGRRDGLVLGDVFEVLRPRGKDDVADRPEDRIALMQIVHVRERSASGMLIQIASPGVADGVPVRLIGKMPS